MTLTVSYDQMSAVTDSGVRLKAVPLAVLSDGRVNWAAPPVEAGLPCLNCPLSRESMPCAQYVEDDRGRAGSTLCSAKQRKDNRAVIWRKVK